MPDTLFVYGTLRPGRSPDEIANDTMRLTVVGSGSVEGERRDLGDYPGLVLKPHSRSRISGQVLRLPNDPAVLNRLDAYEEYDPANPAKSLFIRRRVPVRMDDGSTLECWVYEYNPTGDKSLATAG